MRKIEIVNRMIIFGMIKENDRKHFMRKNIDDLMRIYVLAMKIKNENMERNF